MWAKKVGTANSQFKKQAEKYLDVPNGELGVNVPGANPTLFTVQGQVGVNKINSDEFTKFDGI